MAHRCGRSAGRRATSWSSSVRREPVPAGAGRAERARRSCWPRSMPLKRREACRGRCETFGEENRMPIYARARAFLESIAKRQILITYPELANALQILPPHSIHRVTEALERLMVEEDAAADRPFIAALAIKW